MGGAMLILIGVQLVISWVLMRVLEELSAREGVKLAVEDEQPAAVPVEQDLSVV
jgi:hypothetical protein